MVHHHDIERCVSLGCYPQWWLVLELVMSRASLGGLWLRHSETVKSQRLISSHQVASVVFTLHLGT